MLLLPTTVRAILPFAFLFHSVAAAPIDKNAILDQLRKSGACCTALEYFLPDRVNFVTDLAYTSSQLSFWSAQEQSVKPTCIVVPISTQDVSTAVTILSVAHQASIAGCKFAVRGAGHTPNAGAANIQGGVTIDMQSMNQVTVAGDQKTVSIGAGNRWGNVYGTLDKLDLAMVGGRVTPVGAGGLLTGGGISFFSGRYGLACDNLQAIEIVLANGTIATASSSRNSDLFRAIKGGSNNFGVVTRFDSKLFQQSEFWGGTLSQPITVKEAVFDFFVNFTVSATFDPYGALITDFAWLAGIPTILHNIAYTDGSTPWPPPSFKQLDDLPKTLTTIRKDELSSFTNEIAALQSVTNGRQNLFVTATFTNKVGVTPAFLADVFALADAAQLQLLTAVGFIFTMSIQPLPHVLYAKSAPNTNVLGLDRSTDDLILLSFAVSWQLALDSPRIEAGMQALEAAINAGARQKGLFNEWVYLNYAALWQDPIRKYGDANVGFLREVSRKYDPSGVFQRGVPGGFKLPV
ncbi:hypothetical protein BDV95DRAFT_632739 [Massariosphaeria phaeospora]|uniref:FAD-binding PCMH-type domain-containing protein n=1 Tax=Massariosphaeria phaeospora TaxID=100035 RepID=A0A7C8M133_9PLEO|nr:hypothetical protein BDV95DRAFT_632739 [Massariosphaeria phaeospora]